MKIINDYITSVCRPYKSLTAIGITLHDTATLGGTAKNERAYFQSNPTALINKASAHAFIDWTETRITIPLNERANHAYAPGNMNFIGVELCVPKSYNATQFGIVYNSAVEFFATEFIKRGWSDPFEWIMTSGKRIQRLNTHNEITVTYKVGDHTDPTSYLKSYGKTINDFRQDVKNMIMKLTTKTNEMEESEMEYKTINDIPDWGKQTINKLIAKGAIKADGDGDGVEDGNINIPESMLRTLVVLDRLKKLD